MTVPNRRRMELTPEQREDRRRELLRSIGCVDEADLALLRGDTAETTLADARYRGTAPPFISFGRAKLYPVDHLADWLRERVVDAREVNREPKRSPGKRRAVRGASASALL